MKFRFLYIFIILIFIFSCKIFTKPDKIIIGYDNGYYTSFEGKLSKKIIIDFLKKNNYAKYEFKSMPSDNLIKDIKSAKIDMAIINLILYSKNDYTNIYKTKDLFSEAIYFIVNESDSKYFSYPESIKSKKIGVIYQSKSYDFILKNFGEKQNFNYYKNIDNLITDFNEKKITIIILSREEYYNNILILPQNYLFFVEDNKTYGNIIFSDNKHYELFNIYLEKRKNKEHEWSQLFLPDTKIIIPFLNIK